MNLAQKPIHAFRNQPSKRSYITEMVFVSTRELETYVPPQNSMEVREPAVLFGSASRSSTGMPMDTTLTGSGYVSSKTARRPWMALAAASGTSLAYTDYREGNTMHGGYGTFEQVWILKIWPHSDTEQQKTTSKIIHLNGTWVLKWNI